MCQAANVVLLEVRRLSKHYPGVQALDGVDWAVRRGEVHALVGPNGAGKSTLVNIIAGSERPDSGEVWIDGKAVSRFDPLAAAAAGVAIVPQRPALFPSASVLDNLFVGVWPGGSVAISWRKMADEARAVFRDLGIDINPWARVGELAIAGRQMVQIARALLHDAQLLIFDEPTAALSAAESAHLFSVIRRMRDAGRGVVYITHRLPELSGLADRVTVMRDGRVVATLDASEAPEERIVELMAGGTVARAGAARTAQAGPVLLSARCLRAGGLVDDCSLELRAGEILGVTGLAGSGAAELCRALAGAIEPEGEITVEGRQVRFRSVTDAQRFGIYFVPADRQREGLFPGLSVRENLVVTALRQVAGWGGLVRHDDERKLAQRLVEELGVRLASIEQPVETLSGGNQQKTLVGRALCAGPRVLVLVEPTQGVDVAARAEIHRLLRELAARGVGIIVAGSDVPELLGLCDRLIVMHRGRIAAGLDTAAATEELVLRYSAGVGKETGGAEPANGAVGARRPGMRP
ncbi:MAG: sugar ABC transporter ATP-binding protein, partial [Armatimonadetes bacterium]|nr:sugar ABC transporter ATP-binding protein [Armatimonadota bacterium]